MEESKKSCEYLQGNVAEFEIKEDDCEIRADIKVDRKNCVRVWGRVLDSHYDPVESALVKLIKRIKTAGKVKFEGIAHTVTDCHGFYQFDICGGENCEAEHMIIAGKAAKSKERQVKDD